MTYEVYLADEEGDCDSEWILLDTIQADSLESAKLEWEVPPTKILVCVPVVSESRIPFLALASCENNER